VKVIKWSIPYCSGFFVLKIDLFLYHDFKMRIKRKQGYIACGGTRFLAFSHRYSPPLHWIFTLSNRARSPASFLDAAKLKIVQF
jgi:hypothetical protein